MSDDYNSRGLNKGLIRVTKLTISVDMELETSNIFRCIGATNYCLYKSIFCLQNTIIHKLVLRLDNIYSSRLLCITVIITSVTRGWQQSRVLIMNLKEGNTSPPLDQSMSGPKNWTIFLCLLINLDTFISEY